MFSSRRIASFAVVAGLAGFNVMPASAQQASLEVGTLACKVDGQISSVFGGARDISCDFIPVFSGTASAKYKGTISNAGLNLGFHTVTDLSWAVLAPVGASTDKALSGTYLGTGVSGSIGVGGGSNVLFNVSGDGVSLQPVSLQFQTGLNASIGGVELQLNLAESDDGFHEFGDTSSWNARVTRGG